MVYFLNSMCHPPSKLKSQTNLMAGFFLPTPAHNTVCSRIKSTVQNVGKDKYLFNWIPMKV